jgi:DNA repair ATPase RecN
MPSSQELADLIQARKSLLPEELPYLPPSVTRDDIPSTPPEQLARIDDARAEVAKLQGILDDVSRLEEMETKFLQPMVELCNSLAQKNKKQAARIEELEKEIETLRAEPAESKSQSKTATP